MPVTVSVLLTNTYLLKMLLGAGIINTLFELLDRKKFDSSENILFLQIEEHIFEYVIIEIYS